MPPVQYHLHLKGYVGGPSFNRDDVYSALKQYAGKSVYVLMDSLGGSVATALSIAAAFKNHGDVTVHFVGMNASASTIASLGAKHISMDASAMYLVHKCSQSFFEWGSLNSDQFAQLIADCEHIKADLDKIDANIALMYAAKCKKDKKALLGLMKEGGWLTAQEAGKWGFVDEITDLQDDKAPELTAAMVSDFVAAGIPVPDIPVTGSRDGAFSRFLHSMVSFFNANSKTNENMIKTQNSAGGQATAENRLAELEKQVNDLTDERDSLKTELENLKAGPADKTTTVVEDNKKTQEPPAGADPVADFCRDMAEAKKMYGLLH